ncbi:MAG: hypothetical protein LBJ67_13395 [Planctomycetaceae bacterium]|jgi:hypothetical protein|nr:hypothetical protein [Planctomycetaceae bacterium]
MEHRGWIDGIFNQRVIGETELDWSNESVAQLHALSSKEMISHVMLTFSESGNVLKRFSNEQVAAGITFICHEGYEPFFRLYDSDVPVTLRQSTIASIGILYRDCFAERCTGVVTKGKMNNCLDAVCYMFWDVLSVSIGGFNHNHDTDDDRKILIDAFLDVLVDILFLPNGTCRESALHGIGHMIMSIALYTTGTFQKQSRQKLEDAIDRFCQLPDLPDELRRYAVQAKTGQVQ